jgi:hypothetical protein
MSDRQMSKLNTRKIMSDNNAIRVVASEIVHRLYVEKDTEQLKLLQMQIQRSLEVIAEKSEPDHVTLD